MFIFRPNPGMVQGELDSGERAVKGIDKTAGAGTPLSVLSAYGRGKVGRAAEGSSIFPA